jgi:protein SCO1/2
MRVGHLIFVTVMATCLWAGAVAHGQINDPRPKATDGMAIVEHLSETVPLDVEFVDEAGLRTTLGQYFTGARPVILSLNYSRCPRLCNLQLGMLIEALQDLDWSLGKEFDLVVVSIDPAETPEQARKAKNGFLKTYRRMEAGKGVHFLTGREVNIRRVATAVGFPYKYQPEVREYAHPAVCMVCTPQGKLSRYLYGVEFPRKTLRMALLEAGEGRIGTVVEQILLFCYHYDPDAGVYSMQARRLASMMGGLTVVVILCATVPYWLFDPRRKAKKGQVVEPPEGAGPRQSDPSEPIESGAGLGPN